jgi:hypothetical protein
VAKDKDKKSGLKFFATGLNAEIGCLLLGQPKIVDSVDINAALGAHLDEGYP